MTAQQVRNRRDVRDGGIPRATYVRAGGTQRSEHERNRGKKNKKWIWTYSMAINIVFFIVDVSTSNIF